MIARSTWVVVAAVLGALGAGVGPAWAGGNTQVRNPSNLSDVINRVWDPRMLPITWVLSQDGLPGSGITNATLASELQTAFTTWESLSTSTLDFTYGGQVPLRQGGLSGRLGPGIDGRNLITFTDPDVVFPTGVLAIAMTFSFTQPTVITDANNDLNGDGTPDIPNGTYPAGTIFDGDIVFNSSESWSTAGDPGSIDIRAVALHEIGHLTGLSHSSIRDAVMWPFLSSNIAAARTVKPDDVAYASVFYPQEPAFSSTFGGIRGRVTNGFSTAPVLGAHVFAVDPLTGTAQVGAFTGDDGRYFIPGLTNGTYLVAIEPLDGDPPGLDPFRINEVIQFTADTNFPEEFYDADESNVEADPLAALAVSVTPGGAASGIDLVTNSVQVPGANLILYPGYNLIAYPVEVPTGLTAFDLLRALGTETEVHAIDRFVPSTGTFERAEYNGGIPSGIDFPIQRGEGYLVHMAVQKVVSFLGKTDCPSLALSRGLNLVGVPCPPAGYTAFTLLQHLGASFEVETLQRFDPQTGVFQLAQYNATGAPTGSDFAIKNGEGYLVAMRGDKTGVAVPPPGADFPPVLTGLTPGRGVAGTLVLILGEGFEPDATKNVVTFNGIGAGVIFATATSLTVTVPAAATTGPVRVAVNGRYSNGIEFVVETSQVAEAAAGDTELVSGQTATGALTADGEQDTYLFTALAGSLVSIVAESVTPGVPDLVLVLQDPYGVVVATNDNAGNGTDPSIRNVGLQTTGVFTIVVSNVPGSGTGSYRLSLTVTTRSAPPQISILDGNFQTGVAGSTLPTPLKVLVTGPTGAPVSGFPVTFVATDAVVNGSRVTPINAGTAVLATGASGIVTVQTTLPAGTGNYTITVTVPGMAPVAFVIAATNVAVRTITINGDRQSGQVGQPLGSPLEVVLKDAANNPVVGGLVAFLVVSGGGSVNPSGGVNTDATGKSATIFTLGTKTDTPQLVAAFVPGQSKPILFEGIPQAGPVTKITSNRTNFNRLTLNTARLNAVQVEVFDQYGNRVPGATIAYTAPAGLTVSPGLGPNGIFFTDFKTNLDGLHVAMVTASATPTIDEFGGTASAGLAGRYTIVASVSGLSQTYHVDVDMGPTMLTASTQNDSALIGRPLASPVRKQVLRYQRLDTYTDADGDGKDDDNGDFRDENFSRVEAIGVQGVTIDFEVRREDGKDADITAGGFQLTRTAAASATTSGTGIATIGVTMGDVGGVSHVVGTIAAPITVTWTFADGTPLPESPGTFTSGTHFAESTNLRAIPVVITVTLADAGSKVDFATVKALLNGTAFFDGAAPPTVLSAFPERLDIIVGGTPLKALTASLITDSLFPLITMDYYPPAPKLITGTNSVEVRVDDKIGNRPAAPAVGTFTFP